MGYRAYYSDGIDLVALYRDGQLLKAGTQREVTDAAIALMAIDQVYSESFLLGRPKEAANAAYLEANIEDYDRQIAVAKADEKRREAAKLLEEAEALDPQEG